MSGTVSYVMDAPELQRFANNVKDLLLQQMVDRDEISPEKAKKLQEEWHVVVYQRGFFGRIFDKLMGIEEGDNNFRYRIMRDV